MHHAPRFAGTVVGHRGSSRYARVLVPWLVGVGLLVSACGRQAEPFDAHVTNVALLSADMGEILPGYDAVEPGTALDLSEIPEAGLDIRADIEGSGVVAVHFVITGASSVDTLSDGAPFLMVQNARGGSRAAAAWTPVPGTHSVTVTPVGRSGVRGVPSTVEIDVHDREPDGQEPAPEDPPADEPAVDAPPADEPDTEEPVADGPAPEEPAVDEPSTEPGAGVPEGAVVIAPGTNIQNVIDEHPAGTTYYLLAGVHRMQTFSPDSGDTLLGEEGAVLSGARRLTEFVRDGDLWYAPDQTQYGGPMDRKIYKSLDICIDNHTGVESPRCNYPEDLFIDDVTLHHVASKADVRPGTWFFDYDADRIYLADDPAGHVVETSVAGSGISSNGARDVVIRNVIVEKYAVQATEAALHTGESWVVEDSEARFNHGIGVRLRSGSVLRRSRSHHNGQMGVSAIGDGIAIEDSRIDHNNVAGFATGWAGGGTKFVRTTNMTVLRTEVHYNDGPGLWFDYGNFGSVSAGNDIRNNTGPGFLAEASFDLVVENNLVEGNGHSRTSWMLGAGILVNSSNGVTIRDNVLRDNYQGVGLIQAKWSHEIGNVTVKNNLIDMPRGQTGMVVMGTLPDPGAYYDNAIRFEANEYRFGGQDRPFEWESEDLSVGEWTGLGMDAGGTFETLLASRD